MLEHGRLLELAADADRGDLVLTQAFPEIWLYFLGALFIAVTLFLPQGIVGLVRKLRGKTRDLQA